MPTETSRKRSVRRIYAPGTKKDDKDKIYIPLKVTDEITFKEDVPPGQEWVLTFDNSPESSRSVHVVDVGSTADKASKLKVEFVDSIETEEDLSKQEAIWSFLGNKDNPPVHLETYKRKIYLSDGNGNIIDKETWIEVQRIRAIEFEDQRENPGGQEYIWTLKHPDEEDASDDYTGVKNAVTGWDFTEINPPYRIDPFQTIVDAQFGKVLLVLYGMNKIAAVKISKTGKFTVASKKTLVSSSWHNPHWSYWFSGNVWDKPTFFLPTSQIKISNTMHAMSSCIKIVDGVISVPENMEQRPVYNVADTILKFAESSTPETDYFGLSAEAFGPSTPPMLNGAGNTVYNENGDKFDWSKTGIVRSSAGTSQFPDGFDGGASSWGWIASVDTDGGRYSRVYVYNHESSNDFVYPFSDAQSEAESNWRRNFPSAWDHPVYLYYYGPTNADFTGQVAPRYNRNGAESGSSSVTARMAVYKKSGSIDQIASSPITVTESYTYNDSSLYNWSINYAGITTTTQSIVGPWRDVSVMAFPHATGTETSKMFYRIEEIVSPQWRYTYHTPYETWTTPDINFSDFTTSLYRFYDPFYSGWLQVSDGEHLIQGYIKEGKKRLFLDGVEAGSSLAAAIGCNLEDIVTLFLGVEMSDIKKLK